MWFEYCTKTNQYQQDAFFEHCAGNKHFFTNKPLPKITSIDAVRELEYAQIIVLNEKDRKLSFARDYLGFHPLLYACHQNMIFISDDIKDILSWLQRNKVQQTFSELAVALYFTMGYVPQGFTLLEQIKTCRNASIYHFENGIITEQSIFTAIEPDHNYQLDDLKNIIMEQTSKLCLTTDTVDVWCSGGLDSTIVAYCAQHQSINPPQILSFDYPVNLPMEYRSGELPYVQQAAISYNLPIRLTTLSTSNYQRVYQQFISSFPSPVFDICVPPKFLLAEATKKLALTGEGGDPLFSGVKNNFMCYMTQKYPKEQLGWLYALSHKRFALALPDLFKNSGELKDKISTYFNDLFARYPGDLITKLFYLNTFEKQGGVIFLENYYAQKSYGIEIRHPLTALAVYQSAFKLQNKLRYQYPHGKLALKQMFQSNLPPNIVHRKKSGTLVPMSHYIEKQRQPHQLLLGADFFNHDQNTLSNGGATKQPNPVLFQYANLVLNDWIEQHIGEM